VLCLFVCTRFRFRLVDDAKYNENVSVIIINNMCVEKSKGENLTNKSYNIIHILYRPINIPNEKQILVLPNSVQRRSFYLLRRTN